MDRPLISFMIWCYNQEAYIREAVEGALSQDYSPLEIVICDDCSKDRTFEIVQEIAAGYKGPHQLVLNRNRKNLGIGGNVSQALGLCHGELVVMAGGDDISRPDRTTRTVEAWELSKRKATSIYSRYTVIDEKSKQRPGLIWDCFPKGRAGHVQQQATPISFVRRRRPAFCGCAHAISPKLYSLFGPLADKICYEDTALAFRTTLAGGVFAFIKAPLVKYRWHGSNTTFGLHQVHPQSAVAFQVVQEKRRCELERFVDVYKGFEADALRAKELGLIPAADYPRLKTRILRERRRFELRSELLVCPWFRRLSILCKLYAGSFRPREMMEHLPHLLPRDLYCAAVTARNRRVA
ncbi:MAG TPA: glycosyltransferase [Candidatus Binatia bacterium]|nr:glycosyltransferase [Candidatus Binatia bacterium]